MPLGLFWVLLSEVGFGAGLIAGLAWAGLAIGRRLAVRQKLPTILLISSYSVVAMGIALSLWWFRRAPAGNGIRLRIGSSAPV